MRSIRKLIGLLILLSLGLGSRAQIQECTTGFKSEAEKRAFEIHHQKFQNFHSLGRSTLAEYKWIPVQLHIVRQSNGSGGLSLADTRAALERCNNAFLPTNIRFYECGFNYIDSDTYYTYTEATEESGLVSSRLVVGAANVFIVDEITDGGCGYANFPSSSNPGYANNFILMDKDCMDDATQTTLEHEFGHFFDLAHTHETAWGNELVNGSNCTTAGDRFCDTPADPTLSSSIVNSSCQYTGSATDANNQAYTPDPTNIMSYSRKPCRVNWSQEQIAKMNFTVSDLGPTTRKSLTCTNCFLGTTVAPTVAGGIGYLGELYTAGLYSQGKHVLREITSYYNISGANSVTHSTSKIIATERIRLTPGFNFDARIGMLDRFQAIIDPCGWNIPKTDPDAEGIYVFENNSHISIYPNPFKSETTIKLQVANEDERVTVEIYDLVGKRVAQLAINETFASGTHKLTFNSAEHAGNFFICRVKIDSQEFTEKIVKME